MRDRTHSGQVERWADFCRENPSEFKTRVKVIVDSQIIMARRFYRNLLKTEEGKKIFERLKNERMKK